MRKSQRVVPEIGDFVLPVWANPKVGDRAIARSLGVSRKTVYRYRRKMGAAAPIPRPTAVRPPSALVVPDRTYPAMWRVKWPDGRLSEMVNYSRAWDAVVNRQQGSATWRTSKF